MIWVKAAGSGRAQRSRIWLMCQWRQEAAGDGMKKPEKSKSNVLNSGPRRRPDDAAIHIPLEARRRLAAAAAYFRAVCRRNAGADGHRMDDHCAAEAELEELLRRCHVKL